MLISKGLLLSYILSANKCNLKLKCIVITSSHSNAEALLVLGAGIGSRACVC